MSGHNYKSALTKIAWGYVFLYLNINLGTVDILPAWGGMLLIFFALDGVAERESSAKLLKPFALILIATELIQWVMNILYVTVSWSWIEVVLGIISLYFHFQLLTNLADISERDRSAYTAKLRFFRTAQTVLVTIATILDVEIITWESGILFIIIGALLLIMMIGLVITLFAYKNEPLFHLPIPGYVQYVLDELNDAGHEAFVVGGCVRDALRKTMPKDWDVCTSALPEETKGAFFHMKTIDTGLQHGTVTVLSSGNPVEVTTYRIDGEYLDGRHPENVEFTRSLPEDLARRDFTINAMAYHPSKGVIDLYHGRDDLQHGLIRCVGNPSKRFQEDALRIMRGLRFAAVLDFTVEAETAEAMHQQQERLSAISKERINVELCKLLMGEKADQILTEYIGILEHAAEGIQLPTRNLNHLPYLLPVRLAEVFPKDTATHLRNLRFDNDMIKKVAALAKLRNEPAPTDSLTDMLRFLEQYGEDVARLHYERAGEEELASLEAILYQKPCYQIKDLAVSGADLMEVGLEAGPEMGHMLQYLLNQVIEQNIENDRQALLDLAKEAINHE